MITANAPEPRVVYVVEDDEVTRTSLQFLLESEGLSVRAFASSTGFLAEYDRSRPGCLITDVRLDNDVMTGLELQQHLQRVDPRLPVIVISAYGDIPMAVRAVKSGAVYFFKKPYEPNELVLQVESAFELSAPRYAAAEAAADLCRQFETLSGRESQVLTLVAENGLSSREIGELLGVSYKTVEAHRARFMLKLGATSIPHLMQIYLNWKACVRRSDSED